jgi:hypothetical protein
VNYSQYQIWGEIFKKTSMENREIKDAKDRARCLPIMSFSIGARMSNFRKKGKVN